MVSNEKCLNLLKMKKLNYYSEQFMKYVLTLIKRAKSAVLIAALPPHFNTIGHREPILTGSTV